MKKLSLAVAMLALSAAGASAADLAARPYVKAPPMAVPVFSWTGFYIGGEIGGASINDPTQWVSTGLFPPPAGTVLGYSNISGSGVTGGAYAGYNWQVNSIVFGVEADIEATSLSPSSPNINFPGVGIQSIVNSDKLPWQASFRGRLGYAAGNVLFYGTGGYAVAQINTNLTLTVAPGGTDAFSSTVGGWTGGGGIEYAFTPNWILRGEYRYTQFNKLSTVLVNIVNAPGSAAYQHSITENAGRIGVAYKF